MKSLQKNLIKKEKIGRKKVLKRIRIVIFSLFVIVIPITIFTIKEYKDKCDYLKKEIESLNGYIDLLEEENSIMGSLLGEKSYTDVVLQVNKNILNKKYNK